LNFRFEHSEYLLPLALIPVMIFLFTVVIKWKNTTLKKIGNEKLVKLLILNYSRRNFLIKFVVICIAFALTSFAAANFQTPGGGENIRRQGLDVMIALDVSKSMMATDIQPNRLEKAKLLVNRLIDKLENDQIGLVLFAGRAFLQAPLTPDLQLLQATMKRVDIGLLPDGTAIGTAVALGLNQLKDLPVKASTIVLITDGANNTGKPSPLLAAEAARSLGVRIQAIGLSTRDTSSVALNGVWRVGSTLPRLTGRDEAALQRMAERTGGRYYRATDPEALQGIMGEIDRLERSEVHVAEIRDFRELYPFFLLPALILLLLELNLRALWLRSLP